ncbi:MAG: 2TM domain-containing protein [Rhodoferax sp.]|nr:2TM domain-containing protein [Rhodoferax sp.]
MAPPLTPEEIDRIARKRAGAKLGWYVHALVYVVVNVAMFTASVYGLRQRPWTIYPAMGWGLGLTLHGIAVFLLGSGSGLRERMVHKERERLLRDQQGR